jgi:hypothetical protein
LKVRFINLDSSHNITCKEKRENEFLRRFCALNGIRREFLLNLQGNGMIIKGSVELLRKG